MRSLFRKSLWVLAGLVFAFAAVGCGVGDDGAVEDQGGATKALAVFVDHPTAIVAAWHHVIPAAV